ncbi:hypothetical protein CRYUN_Cryun36dG0040200 [Craigia yunnanensis]
MKEVGKIDELQLGQDRISNGGSSNNRCSSSGPNGPHIELIPTRKSNLKKTTTTVDQENQLKTERRNVSWPDAHGKDIAHVQEFEPSVSDDGELEGVRNSCVCRDALQTGSFMVKECMKTDSCWLISAHKSLHCSINVFKSEAWGEEAGPPLHWRMLILSVPLYPTLKVKQKQLGHNYCKTGAYVSSSF